MAFPADPLDARVELHIGGQWVDITDDTLDRDGDAAVRITRGRTAEGSRSVPTSCALSIRNTNGTYSPRNPASPYYGLIGRNTPLRVPVGTAHVGEGGGSDTPTTSHVAPSVTATGDGLLICAWMADDPGDYTLPGSMTAGPAETDSAFATLASAYEVVGAGATGTRTATFSASEGYASASAVVHGTVTVQETLSGATDAGDGVTLTTADSTQAGWWLVAVQGWIRGSDVPMPDAPYGDDGGWIMLADSGPVAGVTGPFDTILRLRIWARRVNYDGAQSIIFAGGTSGTFGNHAALYVVSGVDDWSIRATVEVSEWPPRWDVSGHVWVPIVGQGVLRRLGQGASPLMSPMRRAILGVGATVHIGQSLLPVAYWPLEDADGSTQAASGLPGGPPMIRPAGGLLKFGAVGSPGSAPLPDVSQWTGPLAGTPPAVSGGYTVGWLAQYTGSSSWTALTIDIADGYYSRLQIALGSTVTVTAVGSSGSETLMSSATSLADGDPHWIEVRVIDNGSGVDYALIVDGASAATATSSGEPGAPSRLTVGTRSGSDAAAIGHVGVWSAMTPLLQSLILAALDGYAGETAGRRIERLCHEEGLAVHIVGDPDDTVTMGPQPVASLLTLLRECEDADGGILYEPRETLGLAYRCRTSLYNQPVTLALTYGAQGEVAPPLAPTDDDRYISNDVTASRSGGSSARYEVTEGPLSVQQPPDGVGRYDHQVTLNVESDLDLSDQASWRAHLGTWDEARCPTVRVNLAALGAAGKAALMSIAAAMDIGDRVTISDLPAWLPPDGIDQHTEGYSETIASYVWDLYLVCSPAGPWQVGVWEDPVLGRADTEGSELAAPFAAGTDTSMSVAVTAGELWITTATHPTEFPFDIRCGGVRLTVTGITGASSPQTFTVAPVNGVVKAIPAGTPVSLWTPLRVAL